ncbi:hypothetical protein N8E89_23310 (plasmid) [Phyllobacterium sp. A18/5-2]|nr:hypothetical protein [Phyllobacterium sp. A18/5-2]UXN66138.1 hypothetical protein N8E89_23310 [Phyllobacterium sp. A18/5-2]
MVNVRHLRATTRKRRFTAASLISAAILRTNAGLNEPIGAVAARS